MRTAPAPAVLAAGLLLALGLTACSTAPEPPTADGRILITYLQKQGDQQYFIAEAAGAKARAAQLGVELTVVNLGSDANRTVSEAQGAIAQRSNGLIVVVPDPAVGPQLVQAAKEAKVALLSSDDQVCTVSGDPVVCAQQNLVPRVGFSGEQLGTQVGKRAAEEFKKAGWNAADTRIVSAWKQDVTVCGDRVKAADEAFFEAVGQVRTIDVPTDNTVAGAQTRIAAALSANPAVKHWVVWGCNDENVQGGIAAAQQAGIGAENVIGVGLGAYLACKDWAAGKPSGMRAALFINGSDVGALAVQTMVDLLQDGKEFPQEAFAPTTMVDPTNWTSSGVKCS
ncbi:substrate-binding domain-containing protein [Kitasatospora azatica]|uniref:substrate-binding domain-containing protein n=1 Tax=Kitasatospora azatica TaxID=58347 RepID=UPI00055B40B5|nr:substrate-binding domain-containing protein [Kitasatospora azatica]